MSAPDGATIGRHGRTLAEIGAISVLGIVATAGFQIVAARGLGTSEFGLLAAFLAIINVVAVGSSALRSSVAVATAATERSTIAARRFWDGPAVEALVLGGIGVAVVLLAGPFLTSGLDAPWTLLVLTAASIVPYFGFARAQGILQGIGATRSVVWWTTGSQLFQLVLTGIVVLIGWSAGGVIVAIFLTALAGTIGASLQLLRMGVSGGRDAFTLQSIVVLLLTVAFAWTTNADVMFVRAGASAGDSGAYAAGAVLVKTTLIVPSILSLYLLPRFVRATGDPLRSRRGLNLTLLLTLASGLVIVVGLWLLSGPIVQILYGDDYARTAELLPWMAAMCLPWSLAQATLISVTAAASRAGLAIALVCAGLQAGAFSLALPDVATAIALNGAVGALTAAGFYLTHLVRTRRR